MKKKILKVLIEGMTCPNCVHHVTEALEELSGVKSIEVRLGDKSAIIEADNIKYEDIKATIEEVGYDVIGMEKI